MPKPDQPLNNEPEKAESGVPDDQSPSLTDLMMLVFSGPLRLDDREETEAEREPAIEAEGAAEEVQSGGAEDT